MHAGLTLPCKPCPAQVGLHEAFSPLYSIEAPEKGKKSNWVPRLLTGVALAFVLWLLYAHHPDLETIKEEAQKAHENLAGVGLVETSC